MQAGLLACASPHTFPVHQWLFVKRIQCAYSSGTAQEFHLIPFSDDADIICTCTVCREFNPIYDISICPPLCECCERLLPVWIPMQKSLKLHLIPPKANTYDIEQKRPPFPKKASAHYDQQKTIVLGRTLFPEALHRMFQQVSWLSTHCFAAPSHIMQWQLR